jgi:hypothetical protein
LMSIRGTWIVPCYIISDVRNTCIFKQKGKMGKVWEIWSLIWTSSINLKSIIKGIWRWMDEYLFSWALN